MKILFIYPNSNFPKSDNIFNRLLYFEPQCFQILKALTPNHHRIELIDERIQKIDFEKDVDLVGITAYTFNANRAYQIADAFRKRNITVILGGWHPSAKPLEAKNHADSVVIGEAEENWPILIKDLEEKNLKSFYIQKKIIEPNNIPTPEPINNSNIISALVQATRGCPNRCEFCALTNRKFGKTYRMRPIKNVINEIVSIKQKYLTFIDDSLTINPDYTKELFENMISLNKKFYCNGNIDVLYKDDTLLKIASEAGCKIWMLGLESISQKTLDFLSKKTNIAQYYKDTIKKIHDYGMLVQGNFIFGFDTENKNIFDKTIYKVHQLNIDIPEFMVLTPYPGTPLFERLKKNNRLIHQKWDQYDLRSCVFTPKNMNSSYLETNTLRVQKEFSSHYEIIKRSSKHLRKDLSIALMNYQLNLKVKKNFS